ncbi:hypothetical protein B0T16DRAFT_175791 [Cercophora newfieldiana]|uniref:Uncharacterized protein n=1 Tax=Cercophora newfieldiana TaxID=92897 RepID=A0AA40CMP4_9PEZI|nr:hypothetical protein B0T16DRAFT_175791 [Cercophora newfieldiana]
MERFSHCNQRPQRPVRECGRYFIAPFSPTTHQQVTSLGITKEKSDALYLWIPRDLKICYCSYDAWDLQGRRNKRKTTSQLNDPWKAQRPIQSQNQPQSTWNLSVSVSQLHLSLEQQCPYIPSRYPSQHPQTALPQNKWVGPTDASLNPPSCHLTQTGSHHSHPSSQSPSPSSHHHHHHHQTTQHHPIATTTRNFLPPNLRTRARPPSNPIKPPLSPLPSPLPFSPQLSLPPWPRSSVVSVLFSLISEYLLRASRNS